MNKSHPGRAGGFSILEVLIAVTILAIGVIGIAALQLTSNAYNESSLHRSQASSLAREMVERMRANPDQAKTGGYDIGSLPSPTENCEGTSANCAVIAMRDHDLRVWSARVSQQLPTGDASIATDTSVTPPQITITMSWTNRRRTNSDEEAPDPIAITQTFIFAL